MFPCSHSGWLVVIQLLPPRTEKHDLAWRCVLWGKTIQINISKPRRPRVKTVYRQIGAERIRRTDDVTAARSCYFHDPFALNKQPLHSTSLCGPRRATSRLEVTPGPGHLPSPAPRVRGAIVWRSLGGLMIPSVEDGGGNSLCLLNSSTGVPAACQTISECDPRVLLNRNIN